LSIPNELVHIQNAKTERAAFAPLYDYYYPKVYSYLLYQVQDPQLADDLAAQVFERVLTRLEQYDPQRGAFSTWLFAIVRNCLKKHWRWQSVRRLVSLDAARNHPASAPALEAWVAHHEQLAQLLPLIKALDERERHILALKFGGGLSNRRIAEITGLTANHVGVLLYRTLKRLRVALLAEEEA
jgi:RNA polymerase sigma-70 factor (ECF subfamily)